MGVQQKNKIKAQLKQNNKNRKKTIISTKQKHTWKKKTVFHEQRWQNLYFFSASQTTVFEI